MSRRSQRSDNPELLLNDLRGLLDGFDSFLSKETDVRKRVIALVPSFHKLRDLGGSLIPDNIAAGMARVLAYLRRYPKTVVDGDELMVVSGIGEWARRLRQLRVEDGWSIWSGNTFGEMAADDDAVIEDLKVEFGIDPLTLKPDQYILMSTSQDRDAAHRWHQLNKIRKRPGAVKAKILEYLRLNVGHPVTGEELRYLAKNKKEWARRSRELRTQDGWPVATKQSGRPDLSIGEYVLEHDRQAEPHDRIIPDSVRVEVLKRDKFSCRICGWNRGKVEVGDPRHVLELHHLVHHKDKGENTTSNLVALCNVDHDDLHAGRLSEQQLSILKNE